MPRDFYWCIKCRPAKRMEVNVPLRNVGQPVLCPHCGAELHKQFPAPYFKVK